MSVESGRRGGNTTKERHGKAHYTRIGQMGGRATKAKHGDAHYRRAGEIGGQRFKELLAKGYAAEREEA